MEGYGVKSLQTKHAFEIQAVRIPKDNPIFKDSKNRLRYLKEEINVEPMKKVDINQFKNYYSYRITDPKKYKNYITKKLNNGILLVLGK